MGDVVDEEYRGRWFSKRNLIVGFISFTLAILSSFFLDYFKQNGFLMWGFIILFLFAIVARLISWKIFEYQYEPKIKLKRGDYFSFFDYVLKLKDSNFGKFSIFRAALSLTSAISSPLLVVYLLRYLEFSYPIYMIITFSGTFFSLILLGLWGKIADWFGNCKIFFLTSFFIPLIPLLWILSSNVFYLIFVPSLIGGVFWAGFNLASSNFIYDNVSREKRGLAVSYFNLLNGVGIFLGAGLSALLMNYLPFEAINSIVLIFLLSFLLRVVVFVLFLPFIKEVRKMNNPFNNSAFESLVFKQVKPTLLEEAHQLMSIKKYFRR